MKRVQQALIMKELTRKMDFLTAPSHVGKPSLALFETKLQGLFHCRRKKAVVSCHAQSNFDHSIFCASMVKHFS
jgi:hypothetical protein